MSRPRLEDRCRRSDCRNIADFILAETCALLGLSPQTVRRHADAGDLPCRRTAGGLRRFAEADVLAYRARRGREPQDVALRATVWTSAALGLLRETEADLREPAAARFRAAAAELRRG